MSARAKRPAARPPSRQERRADARAARATRSGSQWVVPVLAVVFLCSGSAGLVHEVVWARLLGRVFGVTSLAISTVLAAFMGGLALGSWWIGTRAERLRDRRRAYAWLEIGIGVSALLVPLLLHVVEPLYGALWRRFHLSFAALSVVRLVLAGALLLAPTAMMGATLPVLADYLGGLKGHRLAPQWLYTLNLVGAVLGVALAGFVLMPAVGLWGTIGIGAAINLGAGLAVLVLPRLAEARATPPAASPSLDAVSPAALLLVAAFFSGALSFATQVAWTRVLVLIVGSTTYAFSTVLVVYLSALAAGSAWASSRGARVGDARRDLAVMHLLMALGMLAAIYLVNRLPYWYLDLFRAWQPGSIAGIVALTTVIVFGILFLPVACAGTILPLAMIGSLPREARGTGAAVGRIYAVNTVGAIVGSVLCGFVLVPLVGSQATLLGVTLLGAALAVVFALAAGRGRRLVAATLGGALVVLAGILARPDWSRQALSAAVFEPGRLGSNPRALAEPDDALVYYREGPTATVAVIERSGRARSLRINGRVNASDDPSDMPTQILLAQLPLLLAPRTDDVFILGWGSGITAGAALQAPVARVTAVELEPAVVEASRLFQASNHDPLADPRLRLLEDDARHILLASPDTYDVMISEPSHPWVTGVASLFTRDFFTLAAARLREDGIFCQWLQGYQMSLPTFHSILGSFQSVFDEVVVYSPSAGTDWLLLGSRRPLRFDLVDIDRRLADPKVGAENARIGITRAEHVLAGYYVGPDGMRRLVQKARLNTDDNMFVEFRAPADAIQPRGVSSGLMRALLNRFVARPEDALEDASVLLESPARLRALIEGLERQDRSSDDYRRRLATRGP
jgi:spermidine synthase